VALATGLMLPARAGCLANLTLLAGLVCASGLVLPCGAAYTAVAAFGLGRLVHELGLL
jgi:hypothetical protein